MACVLSLPSTDDRSREELSLLELGVSGTFAEGSETKSENQNSFEQTGTEKINPNPTPNFFNVTA